VRGAICHDLFLYLFGDYVVPPLCCILSFSFVTIPRPPRSTLFPYTTLFRSSTCPSRGTRRLRVLAGAGYFDSGERCTRASRSARSEEHTSELQSHLNLVCRLLLEKKKKTNTYITICTRRESYNCTKNASVVT